MSINTEEFMREFNQWVAQTNRAYDDTLAATALDMFSKIVRRTPVDSGRLRGNWQVGLGSAPSGVNTTTDRGGSTATNNARAVLSSYRGGSIYFSNNLPYAMVAEYGLWGDGPKTSGGFSNQAPSGMVRVTLTEFTSALQAAARNNRI